jgi:hypothetical protein
MIKYSSSNVHSRPTGAIKNLSAESTLRWQQILNRFLQAIAPRQRDRVACTLRELHNGGSGLRQWLGAMVWRGAYLPDSVLDIYLSDPEAMPLYDCSSCGLAVPVRPSRLHGLDGEPEEIYFSKCPCCGADTGPFSHFTKVLDERISDRLRRRPR